MAETFGLTVRYSWLSPLRNYEELGSKPCSCCGCESHSIIQSYRDTNLQFRRRYTCPVITGTDPDPFYEHAGDSLYLGLTLDPGVLAKYCQYDHDQVDEVFEERFKLIKHPIRMNQFKQLVLNVCDRERRTSRFKRYVPDQEEWDEFDSDDSDGMSAITEDC